MHYSLHSGFWCCITTSSLVTNSSMVQKMLPWQTLIEILNVYCYLEHSHPVFSHVSIWLQRIKSSEDIFWTNPDGKTDRQTGGQTGMINSSKDRQEDRRTNRHGNSSIHQLHYQGHIINIQTQLQQNMSKKHSFQFHFDKLFKMLSLWNSVV